MVTGDSFKTFAGHFHLGASTVNHIIKNTCDAIWMELKDTHMKPPERRYWEHIEEGFRTKWNFPNCCGVIDRKHVNIQAPENSDSLFFNYKGTFSLILMSLVCTDYQFIYKDIGDYGSQSDDADFKNSNLGLALFNGELDIPEPKELPNYPEGGVLPYCWEGDEAFQCRIGFDAAIPQRNKQC